MTASALPDPLVPAEVDLRGLEYMPLLGDRLFSSDFDLDANDTEFRVGMKLWWAAWKQVPAGSLPKDDSRLCKLAGLGENPAKWKKVRGVALRGFIECSDGRLYHPVVAQQAMIAWDKRGEHIAEKAADNERKRREREERSQMFAALKAVGVTPAWNIKTGELRKLVTEHVTAPVTPQVTGQVTEPVTVTVTAKTGRDGTGIEEKGRASALPTPPARDPGSAQPEVSGHDPTRAGLACRAMRKAGLQATNPGDPRLIALCEQGATDDEFAGLAAEAVEKGKGFAWVLVALQARRAEAAAIALAPPPAEDPDAWLRTRSGVINRACQLGIGPWDEVAAHVGTGPSWGAYRQSVIEAAARQGATA